MNRRDYLKRMGAAGMLAGATGLKGFAHEYAEPQQTCLANPTCTGQTAPLVWQPARCEPLPSDDESKSKCVKLIFAGLTGFARRVDSRGKTHCDVGFHSKGESPIHHQLSVFACSNVGASNRGVSRSFEQQRIGKIELSFVSELDQTYFYQHGDACRRRALTDEKDFRWIVDFESDYLYRKHLGGAPLEKKADVYSPILNVESGIFYTFLKSASTFLARSEDDQYFIDMGNVARIIAANIYVKSGALTLKVDNVTVPVQPPGEIYFLNHCMKGNNDCDFDSGNANKKLRSDFFLNYKAFDRKNHPEYQLHLLESNTPPPMPEVLCEVKQFTEMTDHRKKINDESPCSAGGYGVKTDGLTTP